MHGSSSEGADDAATDLARLRNPGIAAVCRRRRARRDSLPRVPQLHLASDQRADGERSADRTARRPAAPALRRAHDRVRSGRLDVRPPEARAPHRRLADRIRGDRLSRSDVLRDERPRQRRTSDGGRPPHRAHRRDGALHLGVGGDRRCDPGTRVPLLLASR